MGRFSEMRLSRHYQVGSGEEEDDCGQDCIQTQSNQTKPINDHRSELPVRDDQVLLILLPESLGK